MAEHSKVNPTIITLGLACLTAVLAYLGHQSRLTSERPKNQSGENAALIGDQTQPARLWQDPFSVVKAGRTNQASPMELSQQCAYWQAQGRQVSLLAVFLPGAPYPEDTEVRLRLRYAVQTALLETGFVPADRAHLGLLGLPWPKGKFLEAAAHARELFNLPSLARFSPELAGEQGWADFYAPFEWFTSNPFQTNKSAMLVLWLQEEAFADFPLRRLLLLQEAITQGCAGEGAVRFNVLGPRSSDTLKALAEDSKNLCPMIRDSKIEQLLAAWALRSPEATAPDLLLYSESEAIAEPRAITRRKLAEAGITNFANLIGTDDQLAVSLVAELKLREVGFEAGSEDKIALISEADTLYGRSLPYCFAAAFQAQRHVGTHPTKALDALLRDESKWPEANLLRFRYLRGLDGTTARDEQDRASKAGASKGFEGGAHPATQEPNRAEGDAQFDYANRMAELIAETVEAETPGSPHSCLKAIGILGSDIYDKLILLQALRPVFPDALFFTTDLDARYLNPRLSPFTRNLIVASGYGVTPGSGQPVTPFRDGYQTAVYLGCKELAGDGSKPSAPAPRIFEVGRTRFVEFPAPWTRDEKRDFYFLGALVVLALLLASSFARAAQFGKWFPSLETVLRALRLEVTPTAATGPDFELSQVQKGSYFWQAIVWFGTGVALVGLCELAFRWSARPDGEPLFLSEGVSTWPTEFVRLLAVAAAVLFLVHAWHRHKRHRVIAWRNYFRVGKFREFQAFLLAERRRSWHPWREQGEQHQASSAKEQGKVILPLATGKRSWRLRPFNIILLPLLRVRSQVSLNLWEALDVPGLETTALVRRDTALLKGAGSVAQEPEVRHSIDAHRLFQGYASRGLLFNRLLRAVPKALLYIVIWSLIMGHFGRPSFPGRGHAALLVDRITLVLSTSMFCVLAFYVIDAVRLTQRFILKLAQVNTEWPKQVLAQLANKRKMDPAHLDGYLNVMFTAQHTKEVSALAFYPFIVLLAMFVARNQFFDHWTWPPTLLAVFIVNAFLIFLSALSIRRAARLVRDAAVRKLQHLQLLFADGHHEWDKLDDQGNKVPDEPHPFKVKREQSDNYGEKIRLTLEEVNNVRAGAYAPVLQDSAVIAALIPSGGAGLFALLQRMLFGG